VPPKKDQDATPGVKLLRMFRKLMLDGRRHFQGDLAEEFQCSPQTIIRLAGEIEAVIGASLESGLENRRRWYQIRTISRSRLGLDFEELRYLSVCRDLAGTALPEQIRRRVDDTIFNLSVLMADQGYAGRDKAQKQQFSFFSKGKIDYAPHFANIEKLLQAVEKQQVCLVRYRAIGKSESKEHRFVPVRLISMSGALYVLGGTLTDDYLSVHHLLNLAIHRIHDVTLIERHFHLEPPDASPDAFGLPWHEPRSFSIRFKPGKAAEYVRERIWADEQALEETDDGGVILHITTRSEPELMAWVRSFGNEARLLGEEDMAKHMEQLT
jgi:predicted DNA-binding transcriptional regulator YafY